MFQCESAFGSQADILRRENHVGFTPKKTGQRPTRAREWVRKMHTQIERRLVSDSRRWQRRTYSRRAIHRGGRRCRRRLDALHHELVLIIRPRYQWGNVHISGRNDSRLSRLLRRCIVAPISSRPWFMTSRIGIVRYYRPQRARRASKNQSRTRRARQRQTSFAALDSADFP